MLSKLLIASVLPINSLFSFFFGHAFSLLIRVAIFFKETWIQLVFWRQISHSFHSWGFRFFVSVADFYVFVVH